MSHYSLAEANLEFLILFACISQVLGLEMNAVTHTPAHVPAGVRDQIQNLP